MLFGLLFFPEIGITTAHNSRIVMQDEENDKTIPRSCGKIYFSVTQLLVLRVFFKMITSLINLFRSMGSLTER
jgi:hypothetical protein